MDLGIKAINNEERKEKDSNRRGGKTRPKNRRLKEKNKNGRKYKMKYCGKEIMKEGRMKKYMRRGGNLSHYESRHGKGKKEKDGRKYKIKYGGKERNNEGRKE